MASLYASESPLITLSIVKPIPTVAKTVLQADTAVDRVSNPVFVLLVLSLILDSKLFPAFSLVFNPSMYEELSNEISAYKSNTLVATVQPH